MLLFSDKMDDSGATQFIPTTEGQGHFYQGQGHSSISSSYEDQGQISQMHVHDEQDGVLNLSLSHEVEFSQGHSEHLFINSSGGGLTSEVAISQLMATASCGQLVSPSRDVLTNTVPVASDDCLRNITYQLIGSSSSHAHNSVPSIMQMSIPNMEVDNDGEFPAQLMSEAALLMTGNQ